MKNDRHGLIRWKHVLCGGLHEKETEALAFGASRAFDEKVESMIVDSHDGANRIQDPHWNKGASHEWGSLIPTICVNVWLRQSKPVIPGCRRECGWNLFGAISGTM